MNSPRLLAAILGIGISAATAIPADAETHFEPAIQYALENLTSGIATSSVVNGTEVEVKPTRTWKSVSGHYCRQYDLTVTEPSAIPDFSKLTRCRDSDGRWKPAK